MYKEMAGMTNEEMFTAIISRIDSLESGLNKRMDSVEGHMDSMEGHMDSMEGHMDSMEGRMDAMEVH
ncbi:MAG: hypothetical protein K2N82_03560, partial [Lachnospiraceae bacterium]|nr:hypothetical protein [Lachnospiraceae bacterium]